MPLTEFQAAFAKDRALLVTGGYAIEIVLSVPGTIRAAVSARGESTKVEWAHDSSWRFMPTVADPRFGFVLHPVDLAVNKALALAGRDEPRDVLDALYQHRDVLCLGALVWAACGKDPGFTPLSLLELLRRRGRIREEEIARLALVAPIDLRVLKSDRLEALDSVAEFADSRPAGEVGCIYYSPSRRAFVDPRRADDAVAHYGRPGGMLPAMIAS